MGTKDTLDILTAVAAILPAAFLGIRRELPLRAVELVHVTAAALLVVAAAAAVHALSIVGVLSAGFRGDREPLSWAVLGAAMVVAFGAWWLLNARPRSVVSAVEPIEMPAPDPDAEVLPDRSEPLPAAGGPLVPRVLFLGAGLGLISLFTSTAFVRFGLLNPDLGFESVVAAVLAGLVAGIPLLAAVLGDDDESSDLTAYLAFALLAGMLLLRVVLPADLPTHFATGWLGPLVLGLSAGLVAPAALDALGDLTAAVRPYALPLGVLAAAALLALSTYVASHAAVSEVQRYSGACTGPDSC
jgi:hypothetical protein